MHEMKWLVQTKFIDARAWADGGCFSNREEALAAAAQQATTGQAVRLIEVASVDHYRGVVTLTREEGVGL